MMMRLATEVRNEPIDVQKPTDLTLFSFRVDWRARTLFGST